MFTFEGSDGAVVVAAVDFTTSADQAEFLAAASPRGRQKVVRLFAEARAPEGEWGSAHLADLQPITDGDFQHARLSGWAQL